MGFKKIIISALTAATVISGSVFSVDTAYAQSVSTKTTFSGDYMNFYAPAGKAVVAYDDIDKNGEIKYLELDDLQRATGAYGYISKDMRIQAKERGRQDIKVDPVGWGNNTQTPVKYEDKSYNGWFYNRSHLIADSLGADPDKTNLVTGTRMQNVGWGNGGMAYIEDKTRDFLDSEKAENCPVYYAATPNYVGSELLPRTVTVNAKSCDNTIDEQIVVDNVAPGYIINYMNGEFKEGEIPQDQLDGASNENDANQDTNPDDNSSTDTPDETQDNSSENNNTDTPGNDNSNGIDNTIGGNTGENTENTDETISGNGADIDTDTLSPQENTGNHSRQSQTQIGGGTQSQSENGQDTTDNKTEYVRPEEQEDKGESSSIKINDDGEKNTNSTSLSSDKPTNTSVSVENNTPVEIPQSNDPGPYDDIENTNYGPKVDTGGQVEKSIVAKIISFFK